MDVEDARDPQQGVQRGVDPAGLDVLEVAPVHRHREHHGLLREVAVHARLANGPADPLAFQVDPLVVVWQVAGHSTNRLTCANICQPGSTRHF